MAEKKKVGTLLAESVLRRRYPQSNKASIIAASKGKKLRLPSKNLALNFQLGGGLPYGGILEEFGEESTGKTLLAMDFAQACISLGGIVLWDDAEACWEDTWAEKNGLDLSQVELLTDENVVEVISDWMADMIVFYRSKLTNNEPILLVTDSLAVLESQDQMEVSDVDSSDAFSRRSKMISQLLRKRKKMFAKYGVCVIFINQLRKKIGATKWEDPDTTPGGQAMKFYADIRLGLYRGKIIKNNKKKRVGQHVYMRIKKNKTAPPRESVQAKVYFKKTGGKIGYDKYSGLGEALIECGVIKVERGPLYFFNGKKLCKGKKDENTLDEFLADNDKIRAELIAASPINTLSKTRDQIKAKEKNLYPVKAKKQKDDEEDEE